MFLKRNDVRYENVALDAKLTLDRLGLQLAIDLDDLLRDFGVVGIGKWDANGASRRSIIQQRHKSMTSHRMPSTGHGL